MMLGLSYESSQFTDRFSNEVPISLSLYSYELPQGKVDYREKVNLLDVTALREFFISNCPKAFKNPKSEKEFSLSFQSPGYKKDPKEWVQEIYLRWRGIEVPVESVFEEMTDIQRAFKTVIDYNERCDLVSAIYKRILQGSGSEVLTEEAQEVLRGNGINVDKHPLGALIELLFAYYGIVLPLGLGPQGRLLKTACKQLLFEEKPALDAFLTSGLSSENITYREIPKPLPSFEYGQCLFITSDPEFSYDFEKIPQTAFEFEEQIISALSPHFPSLLLPRVIPNREFEIELRAKAIKSCPASAAAATCEVSAATSD